ncbi:MAG: hypothetical protein K2X39_03825 [Silvanigrellaceae bacterium]|nr:hypothetical protein [Silvanigrellaceae bacterium]
MINKSLFLLPFLFSSLSFAQESVVLHLSCNGAVTDPRFSGEEIIPVVNYGSAGVSTGDEAVLLYGNAIAGNFWVSMLRDPKGKIVINDLRQTITEVCKSDVVNYYSGYMSSALGNTLNSGEHGNPLFSFFMNLINSSSSSNKPAEEQKIIFASSKYTQFLALDPKTSKKYSIFFNK